MCAHKHVVRARVCLQDVAAYTEAYCSRNCFFKVVTAAADKDDYELLCSELQELGGRTSQVSRGVRACACSAYMLIVRGVRQVLCARQCAREHAAPSSTGLLPPHSRMRMRTGPFDHCHVFSAASAPTTSPHDSFYERRTHGTQTCCLSHYDAQAAGMDSHGRIQEHGMVVEALEQLRRAPQYKVRRALLSAMCVCMHTRQACFLPHVHEGDGRGRLVGHPDAAAPCQHTHCRSIAPHNIVWIAPATCMYVILWCAAAASAA